MDFVTSKLLLISLFILLIHAVETLAYATRLSGARVGLIASAVALFNVMVIVSRTANMIQQPFTGGLIDSAPVEGTFLFVENQFRFLIGAATLGTVIGILLMPTYINLFSRAIIYLKEEHGSIPRFLKKSLRFSYLKRAWKHRRLPKFQALKGINFRAMPFSFFMTNMVITAIYTIGVFSALYASLLAPERETTAIMASGLVNGIATMLLVIFVDPKVSVMADEVSNKRGDYLSLRDTTAMLIVSRLAGTLLAQALFIPGAQYIAWLTKFFV